MELERLKRVLLSLPDLALRTGWLRDFLARAVQSYEERARVHDIAKGNGHSGKHIDLE